MNHLADQVRQERLRRRWSVRTAAAAGKISNTWWGKFEDYYQPLTPEIAAAVSRAFNWPPSWAADAGGTGDDGSPSQLPQRVDRAEKQLGELRTLVLDLSERVDELASELRRSEGGGDSPSGDATGSAES